MAVAAGSYHSMFLYESGEIRTAGWNAFGQLGHGNLNNLAPSGVVDSGTLTPPEVRRHRRRWPAQPRHPGRWDGRAWGYNQLGVGDGMIYLSTVGHPR